jgi:hypothetical protein
MELEFITSSATAEEILKDSELWKDWNSFPALFPEAFFIHSKTIKAWLSSLPAQFPFVVSRVMNTKKMKCVGLAIFGISEKKVKRLLKIRVLTLLRSGNEIYDQFWPEYVTPVCHPDMLPHWQQWMQLVMSETKSHALITEVCPRTWLEDWQKIDSLLALKEENLESGGVVDLRTPLSFGKSVRRQVSQTERYAKKIFNAELEMHVCSGLEGWDLLLRHKQWHIDKWSSSSTPSGFLNPHFSNAIKSLFENGSADACLARVGNQTVGVMVVLKIGPWAGFYLASLSKSDSNHWHIGTWLHAKACHYYQSNGVRHYDFMAGSARYKEQMISGVGYQREYARGVWTNKETLMGKVVSLLL